MEKNTKIIIGIVLVIIISLGLIFFVVGSVLILSSIPPDPEIISGHDPLYDLPAIMGPLSLYTTNVELEQGAWTQIATIVFNDQSDAAEYTLTTRTKDTGSGNDLDCYIADSNDITDTFNLNSNATEDEVIVIQDTGNTGIGLYACNVKLYRENELIEDQTITVEIV